MDKNCVFCDRSKLGEERIVGETKKSLIIATLGQISNGGYILWVPRKHIPCVGAMSETYINEAIPEIEKTYLADATEYQTMPTMAEHGIVGQTIKHAHLHFVPEICDITNRVKSDFPNCEFVQINTLKELPRLYRQKQLPYLFWLTRQSMNICWNPPAPPQYLRIVIAEEVDRPERANWRNMDPELDKKLWSETVRRMKPYFT